MVKLSELSPDFYGVHVHIAQCSDLEEFEKFHDKLNRSFISVSETFLRSVLWKSAQGVLRYDSASVVSIYSKKKVLMYPGVVAGVIKQFIDGLYEGEYSPLEGDSIDAFSKILVESEMIYQSVLKESGVMIGIVKQIYDINEVAFDLSVSLEYLPEETHDSFLTVLKGIGSSEFRTELNNVKSTLESIGFDVDMNLFYESWESWSNVFR